jgi:hypothetical protein
MARIVEIVRRNRLVTGFRRVFLPIERSEEVGRHPDRADAEAQVLQIQHDGIEAPKGHYYTNPRTRRTRGGEFVVRVTDIRTRDPKFWN